MSDAPDAASAAAALLREGGRLPPASVTPLVSVVRSGEQFLLLQPPEEGSDDTLDRILLEWGYEVPRDQHAAFRQFLSEKNGLLAAPPSGITYLGTYAVFQQSERSLGSFRTIWGFRSLSLMETMTAHVADPADDWGKAVKQLMDFRDPSYTAGRSQVILQLAAATMMG